MTETKGRLNALYNSEQWQTGEIQAAMDELETGPGVSHHKVSDWLRSWGKPGETKAPR